MSFFSRLFGAKYNDEEIVSHVQTAIHEDPLITDSVALSVTSEAGVVTLSGTVHKEQEKDRIDGVVRSVLKTFGLKHERIENELVVD
jgi:osmotically-inducible protein OsmY